MKLRFATAVWGDTYTDLYLKVALPSQLSAGNLPALLDGTQCVYAIHTTSRDARVIRESPAYALLAEMLPTTIVPFRDEDLVEYGKYTVMSKCHGQAIAAADEAGAAIVVLPPDAVWSDGSFATVSRVVASGKRVVLVAGLRVVKETFVPALMPMLRLENGPVLAIPARDLVRTALEHLHPFSRSVFWDSPESNSWPSHLYWHVPGEGMLARCFHLHPLLVNLATNGASFSSTVDDDWIEQVCRNPNDVYVVKDSDELMVCEMSAESQIFGEIRAGAYHEEAVARWAMRSANPLHRTLVRHGIRIHYKDPSLRWREIEGSSDRVIRQVLRSLRRQRMWDFVADVARPVKAAAQQSPSAVKGILRRLPGLRMLVRTIRTAAGRTRGKPEVMPPPGPRGPGSADD